MTRLALRFVPLLSVLATAPAVAADMPVKAVRPLPPVYTWTGLYIGANGGGAWLRNQTAVISAGSGTGNLFTFPAIMLPRLPQSSTLPFSASGGFAGFQAGYNYQLQPGWLVGVETDIQAASIRGSADSTIKTVFSDPFFGLPDWATHAETKIRWFGTARARLGFLPVDSLLLYATGGLAYGEVERTGSLSSTFPGVGGTSAGGTFFCANGSVCFEDTHRRTQVGWTAGVGGEWAFWRTPTLNASIKAEYLHVDLGGGDTFLLRATQPPGIATMVAAFSGRAAFDLVRVGLNVKLDNPAIVARY